MSKHTRWNLELFPAFAAARSSLFHVSPLRASIGAMALFLSACGDTSPAAPRVIEVRVVGKAKNEFTKTLNSGGYTIAMSDPDDDGDVNIYIRGPSGYGQLHCSSLAANGKLLANDMTNWLVVPNQDSIHINPDAQHVDCWAKHGL